MVKLAGGYKLAGFNLNPPLLCVNKTAHELTAPTASSSAETVYPNMHFSCSLWVCISQAKSLAPETKR